MKNQVVKHKYVIQETLNVPMIQGVTYTLDVDNSLVLFSFRTPKKIFEHLIHLACTERNTEHK